MGDQRAWPNFCEVVALLVAYLALLQTIMPRKALFNHPVYRASWPPTACGWRMCSQASQLSLPPTCPNPSYSSRLRKLPS